MRLFLFGRAKLQYELNAESLGFLLGITHNGVKRVVIGRMKPYENGKLIQLLNERELALVNSSTDADALDYRVGGANEANRNFFDAHKLSMTVDGAVASDVVIEKLDALYKIRAMFITLGYLGVSEPMPKADEDQALDLEAEFGDTQKIPQLFTLVDESGVEQKLDLAHVIRFAGAEDRIRWDRAQKLQTLKEGGRRVRYNYETIGHLYDAMVKEAPGFTLDSQPCVEANKPDWIKKIPYIFKFRALDSAFSLAHAKNA
jgi:hypothetical protein